MSLTPTTTDSLMPFSTTAKALMRGTKVTENKIKKEKELLAEKADDAKQAKAIKEIKTDDYIKHIAEAIEKKQNDSKVWSALAQSLAAAAKLDSTLADGWNTICQERDENKQKEAMLKLLKSEAYVELFKKYQSQILPRSKRNPQKVITDPLHSYSKMAGGDYDENFRQDGYQSSETQFFKHIFSYMEAFAETFCNLVLVALGSEPAFVDGEEKKEKKDKGEIVRYINK